MSTECNEKLKNPIRNLSKTFVDSVEPNPIADFLSQKGVLVSEDWTHLETKQTREDKNRYLLDKVLTTKHPRACIELFDALGENYGWLQKEIEKASGNLSNSDLKELRNLGKKDEKIEISEHPAEKKNAEKAPKKSLKKVKKEGQQEFVIEDNTRMNNSETTGCCNLTCFGKKEKKIQNQHTIQMSDRDERSQEPKSAAKQRRGFGNVIRRRMKPTNKTSRSKEQERIQKQPPAVDNLEEQNTEERQIQNQEESLEKDEHIKQIQASMDDLKKRHEEELQSLQERLLEKDRDVKQIQASLDDLKKQHVKEFQSLQERLLEKDRDVKQIQASLEDSKKGNFETLQYQKERLSEKDEKIKELQSELSRLKMQHGEEIGNLQERFHEEKKEMKEQRMGLPGRNERPKGAFRKSYSLFVDSIEKLTSMLPS